MIPQDKTDHPGKQSYCIGVPPDKGDRERIRRASSEIVQRQAIVPPLPLEKLKTCAADILRSLEFDLSYLPFAVVALSNELWRPIVAAIPYDKRLLLLPQCLKHSQLCEAEIDPLGLLCRHCGQCLIGRFTKRAEELGYAVLVAEGSPVVTALIESGRVQATVGVSCLSVLERVFPYMEAGAVPGIAVPLLVDGCRDTVFDEDGLSEAIEQCSTRECEPVDVTALRTTVQQWFEPQIVKCFFQKDVGHVGELCVDWLCGEGKRYRPILTAGIYSALADTPVTALPESVQRAAVAVECFHKASLIHDDIEDSDTARYEQPTLHHQHGTPIALNAGDYLIGAGYRLLTELECPDHIKIEILRTAAQCHRTLCIGQGEELQIVRQGQAASVEKVLDIFSQKTSPAFEAALHIGAILAGASNEVQTSLSLFSKAVGIGYQIRDDLRDARRGRPDEPLSILASLRRFRPEQAPAEQAQLLLSTCRSDAINALEPIANSACKAFLRKIVTRLFDQSEELECCDAPFRVEESRE